MKQFLFSYATGSDPRELVNTCLAQMGDIPSDATLGIIYLTDALAREAEHLLRLLEHATGVTQWIGTVGMAIAATNIEIYEQPALAVMLTDFPTDNFRLIPTQMENSADFLEENESWIKMHQPTFGILHGDPTNPSTSDLITELSTKIGEGFFVGGLTSSQSLQTQINNGITTGGISGLMLSSKETVLASHTQGCTPIGPLHTVTESSSNVISRLDNKSALDVLKEDVGEVLARDLNRLGGYVFAGLPIQGSDTGDYTVRNLIGIDMNEEKIAIGDLMEEGSQMMFCRRDGNTASQDMRRMLETLKSRSDGKTIRGGVYYSCLGRGRHQFGKESEELKMISQVLGEFPLVGFFANGEIFHNRLYGFTGVLNLFV
jgi:small ligand-binding sensory domain FIST